MKRSRSGKGEGKGGLKTPRNRVSVSDPYAVRRSRAGDVKHISRIRFLLQQAQQSGAIVSVRSEEYLEAAIRERRGVIALRGDLLVGFAAAHGWQDGRFVSHSAMVVSPEFRGRGLAHRIKEQLIQISRRIWPDAAIMTLTLSPSVERMNKSHGFQPVPYCDLTSDPKFWDGCNGCVHQAHLKRNQYQDCHCWAGLLLPPGTERERVIPKDALRRPDNDSFYSG